MNNTWNELSESRIEAIYKATDLADCGREGGVWDFAEAISKELKEANYIPPRLVKYLWLNSSSNFEVIGKLNNSTRKGRSDHFVGDSWVLIKDINNGDIWEVLESNLSKE